MTTKKRALETAGSEKIVEATETLRLGKIIEAKVGIFPDNNVVKSGFVLVFGNAEWQVSEGATYSVATKEDEIEESAKNCYNVHNRLAHILIANKLQFFDQLIGKPVECKFDGNKLLGWRILSEVL